MCSALESHWEYFASRDNTQPRGPNQPGLSEWCWSAYTSFWVKLNIFSCIWGLSTHVVCVRVNCSFFCPAFYQILAFPPQYLNIPFSPGWCGSVDWVPAWEPKGRWFDSPSGHMPGLQARSLVGGMWEVTSTSMLLSFSLLSPLSKNK